MWVRLFARIGFGQWLRYATGIVEAGGGLLLLISQATVVAVPLLTCTMIGALLVHVFIVGVGPQSVAVAVLLVGVVAIGWRRRRRSLGV
jgi:putative oxidoreductase